MPLKFELMDRQLLAQGYFSERYRPGVEGDMDEGLIAIHELVDDLVDSDKLEYSQPVENGQWIRSRRFHDKLRATHYPISEVVLWRLEVSPQIKAFVQICEMLRLPQAFWNSPNDLALSDGTGKTSAARFNEATELIRARALQVGFYRPFQARHARSLDDCRSAMEAILSSTRHRDVFVFRVDLLHGWARRQNVGPGLIKKALGKLLNNWRKQAVHVPVTGFLWKLQFGLLSGFHIHFTVFLDARAMATPSLWIQDFSKVWRSVAGPDAEVREYVDSGNLQGAAAGRWNDKEVGRQRLLRSWTYLLQKDKYFRPKVKPRGRVFGRSEERHLTLESEQDPAAIDSLRMPRARRLLASLVQTGGSTHLAAREAGVALTLDLKKTIARWKRQLIVSHVRPEDLDNRELRRLLFKSGGRGVEYPDYAEIDKQVQAGAHLYPQWLDYFRGVKGHAQHPGFFLSAYREWLLEHRPVAVPFKVRNVLALAIRSARDAPDVEQLRRPGLELELIWDPFVFGSTRSRGQ
jgi:hypothetical protein